LSATAVAPRALRGRTDVLVPVVLAEGGRMREPTGLGEERQVRGKGGGVWIVDLCWGCHVEDQVWEIGGERKVIDR
jgi:hypothetical protein